MTSGSLEPILSASNVRDHVQSDQHAHAVMLLKKQHTKSAGLPPSSCAPLAQAFNRLSDYERGKLQFKFNIAHFVVIEKLPFIKYSQICELESHHGVNLGTWCPYQPPSCTE